MIYIYDRSVFNSAGVKDDCDLLIRSHNGRFRVEKDTINGTSNLWLSKEDVLHRVASHIGLV